MVKQVIWSAIAKEQRKEILSYWNKRNKSAVYSKKLNHLFQETIQYLKEHPEVGRPTDNKKARLKKVRDYFIIYEYTDDLLFILLIWDARQDPEKLDKLLK